MKNQENQLGGNSTTKGQEIFHRFLEPPSGDIRDTLYQFFRAAVAVVGAAFLALILLATAFHDTSAIGQAGDFFGGFVNPLLTFLTFSGVLYTVYIQRQDLNETRKETKRQSDFFERQNFEATFFQMLNLHNGIVNAMETEEYPGEPKMTGRGCFERYYAYLKQGYNDHAYIDETLGMNVAAENAFNKFWNGHRQDLGHYFRYLFNIIRYVDEAVLPTATHSDHDLKMRYMKLLRAQLSDYELLILFYNSLTNTGGRFIPYINKYDILDNIPRDLVIRQSHLTDFPDITIRQEPIDK